MKKIILILFCTTFAYSQESKFYSLEGKILSNTINKSINNISQERFSNIEMIHVYANNDNKNCNGYQVVFKKYSETPLFVIGQFPKSKKKLNKCIDDYNVLTLYDGVDFKNDLNKMVKEKASSEDVIKIFGNTYTETLDHTDEGDLVILNYTKFYGTVKFDLVFFNDELIRYIKY